jgi:acetyl esterase/lipase
MNTKNFKLSWSGLLLACACLVGLSPIAYAQAPLETYGIAPDGAILQWVVHKPAGTGPWPVALVIHGGGFHGGGPYVADLAAAADDLAAAGYLALAITYRLDIEKLPGQTSDGGIPQQTDDCKMAVRAARALPDCDGRVVAVGGSAGGSHAAFLALTGTPGDDQVDAAVCLSAAMDFSDWTSDPNIDDFTRVIAMYCRVPDTSPPSPASLALLQGASPAHQPITLNSPAPMFMVASVDDPMPHTQLPDMVAALQAGGNTVTTYPTLSRYEQLVIPGDLHEFAYWSVPDDTVKNASIAFLNASIGQQTTSPSQLLNISSRLQVQAGDGVLVAGFIVTGDTPKKVLIRGLGPSLQGAGLALPDPVLELHGGNGSLITTDDNWKDSQQAQIEATGIPPTNNLESAIVATLPPGNYTAILSGKNGSGVGLVEVYDLDPSSGNSLANISSRGFVETGNDVIISGFILGGTGGDDAVLVRAIGPSLSNAGVPNPLADPTLTVFNDEGTQIASNDNWQATQKQSIEAAGLAPTNPAESAVLLALPPGNYTALVAGKNGGTGVGLIEVYDLHRE